VHAGDAGAVADAENDEVGGGRVLVVRLEPAPDQVQGLPPCALSS